MRSQTSGFRSVGVCDSVCDGVCDGVCVAVCVAVCVSEMSRMIITSSQRLAADSSRMQR